MFELSLKNLSPDMIERAARQYHENGFLVVNDTEVALLPNLEEVLTETLDGLGYGLGEVLDGSVPLYKFSQEDRETLSQIDTNLDLQSKLVSMLEPVLLRILGPLVHVSRNFHAQFKGTDLVAPAVDHGGYPDDSKFLEPFGQYLIHQDFTGARLPTSPGGMTCWVPLTTGENWGLRLYPGSHRKGIVCHDWIPLEDERLNALGEPFDFPAHRGKALLFHSLILHSSVHPGDDRRVSIDVRFFPLCGYLPSAPWVLGDNPERDLVPVEGDGDTLAASRFEAQVYLGRDPALGDVPAHSTLNWVNYINEVAKGDRDAALPHLERFTNPDVTGEGVEIYREKYHAHTMHDLTMERAKRAISAAASEKQTAPRLAS